MARIVISYYRFSTPKQREGRSLRRQLKRAQRWARKHACVLDETLSCGDEGLSGYWGDHAVKGNLSRFVALCGTPHVPPGSVLLIEDFDRLSRQTPDDAWELFRRILLSGVEIVVLTMDRWFTRETLNNYDDRMLVQAAQHRAHQESKRKASHGRDVWAARRRAARRGKVKHNKLPGWMRRVRKGRGADALALIPERADTLREMVRLAKEGLGMGRIAAALNADPAAWPCWLKRGRWEAVSVHHHLTHPALWGGYQPHTIGADRKPVTSGAQIAGVYPAVIDQADADQVVRLVAGRAQTGGRTAQPERSMLSRLVFDSGGSIPLRLRPAGRLADGRVAVYLDRQGPTRREVVVQAALVETLVLRVIQRWTPETIAPDAGPPDPKLRALTARLREVQEQRAEAKAAMRGARAGGLAALVAMIDEADDEEQTLKAQLERLSAAVAPSAACLEECQSLAVQWADAGPDQRGALCVRLNARLRDLIQGVWVWRQTLGPKRAAVYVQVWPRVGPSETVTVMVGRPPDGWVPADVQSVDFRVTSPAT